MAKAQVVIQEYETAEAICTDLLAGKQKAKDVYRFLLARPQEMSLVIQGIILALAEMNTPLKG